MKGEGEHLLDAVVVGLDVDGEVSSCLASNLYIEIAHQEHDEAIDTHAPATSRWEAVFERLAESFIDELGFVITLILLVGLLFL